MRRDALVAIGAAIIVAIVAAVWYAARDRVDATEVARVRPAGVAPVAPPLAPGAVPNAHAPGALAAPWMTATPGGSAPNATGAKAREIEGLKAELAASVRAGVAPDPRKVDATLAKIEALNGTNVVQGVNLDAVRTNLAIASKLQAIAADMEAESNKGANMDNDRLRTLVAQVQQLQSQMRADVSVPAQSASQASSTSPQPASPPAPAK